MHSASEVKKWIPGIKREIDYYLQVSIEWVGWGGVVVGGWGVGANLVVMFSPFDNDKYLLKICTKICTEIVLSKFSQIGI